MLAQIEKQRRFAEKKLERQKGGRRGGRRGEQPELKVNRSRSTKKGGFSEKPAQGKTPKRGGKGRQRR